MSSQPTPATAHGTTGALCLVLALLMIASVPFTLYGPIALLAVQVVAAVVFGCVALYHFKRARIRGSTRDSATPTR